MPKHYEASSRKTGETFNYGAFSLSSSYSYDSEGRVSDEVYTTGDGRTIASSYDYDAFGRLQTISGPDGVTSYEYNAQGQKIAVSGPSGDTRFGYDAWGNL